MPGDFDERGIAIDAGHSIHLDGKPLVSIEEGYPKNPALALRIEHPGAGYAVNTKIGEPRTRTIVTARKPRKWLGILRVGIREEVSEVVSTPVQKYEVVPYRKRDADSQYFPDKRIPSNKPSAIFKNCFLMLDKAGTPDDMTSAINNFLATPQGKTAGSVVGILHQGPQGRVLYPFNSGNIVVKHGDSVLYSPEIREKHMLEDSERRARVPAHPISEIIKNEKKISELHERIQKARELLGAAHDGYKRLEELLQRKDASPYSRLMVDNLRERIRTSYGNLEKLDLKGVSEAYANLPRIKAASHKPMVDIRKLTGLLEKEDGIANSLSEIRGLGNLLDSSGKAVKLLNGINVGEAVYGSTGPKFAGKYEFHSGKNEIAVVRVRPPHKPDTVESWHYVAKRGFFDKNLAGPEGKPEPGSPIIYVIHKNGAKAISLDGTMRTYAKEGGALGKPLAIVHHNEKNAVIEIRPVKGAPLRIERVTTEIVERELRKVLHDSKSQSARRA